MAMIQTEYATRFHALCRRVCSLPRALSHYFRSSFSSRISSCLRLSPVYIHHILSRRGLECDVWDEYIWCVFFPFCVCSRSFVACLSFFLDRFE